MPRSLVRVVCENPDDEIDSLTFDVLVDERGQIVREYQSYGVWGNSQAGYIWPFVILTKEFESGVRLDFGGASTISEEDAERFGWTNLPGKRVKVGEYLTIRYDEVEYTFRMKSAADRLSLVPFAPD